MTISLFVFVAALALLGLWGHLNSFRTLVLVDGQQYDTWMQLDRVRVNVRPTWTVPQCVPVAVTVEAPTVKGYNHRALPIYSLRDYGDMQQGVDYLIESESGGSKKWYAVRFNLRRERNGCRRIDVRLRRFRFHP